MLVKTSLTALGATRRAQRNKPKLRLRESVYRVHTTKQHAWGFEKPRTQGAKKRKSVNTCLLILKRRTVAYIYDLSFLYKYTKYPIVKLIL